LTYFSVYYEYHTKKFIGGSFVIEISESEAKQIIKHVKKNQLVRTGRKKRKGQKTYFLMASDNLSVGYLLKLRNLRNKRQLFGEGDENNEQSGVYPKFCKGKNAKNFRNKKVFKRFGKFCA
jgi:predicted DNA binding protein